MTTKLQAKAIKAEIRTLNADIRADEKNTHKAVQAIDREVLKLEKKRTVLIDQCDARIEKREKRVAILEGRL